MYYNIASFTDFFFIRQSEADSYTAVNQGREHIPFSYSCVSHMHQTKVTDLLILVHCQIQKKLCIQVHLFTQLLLSTLYIQATKVDIGI